VTACRSGEWGAGGREFPAPVEVLFPSFERPAELAVPRNWKASCRAGAPARKDPAWFGGAGILPSSAVHLEYPTGVTDRSAGAPEIVPLAPLRRGSHHPRGRVSTPLCPRAVHAWL